jgi:hypothetical protein
LANLLNGHDQRIVTAVDYIYLLRQYTQQHLLDSSMADLRCVLIAGKRDFAHAICERGCCIAVLFLTSRKLQRRFPHRPYATNEVRKTPRVEFELIGTIG